MHVSNAQCGSSLLANVEAAAMTTSRVGGPKFLQPVTSVGLLLSEAVGAVTRRSVALAVYLGQSARRRARIKGSMKIAPGQGQAC